MTTRLRGSKIEGKNSTPGGLGGGGLESPHRGRVRYIKVRLGILKKAKKKMFFKSKFMYTVQFSEQWGHK